MGATASVPKEQGPARPAPRRQVLSPGAPGASRSSENESLQEGERILLARQAGVPATWPLPLAPGRRVAVERGVEVQRQERVRARQQERVRARQQERVRARQQERVRARRQEWVRARRQEWVRARRQEWVRARRQEWVRPSPKSLRSRSHPLETSGGPEPSVSRRCRGCERLRAPIPAEPNRRRRLSQSILLRTRPAYRRLGPPPSRTGPGEAHSTPRRASLPSSGWDGWVREPL